MSDIYTGDSREVRSVLADNSIDTIITDPPYGLEFMGKGWDRGVPGVEFWKEFLAVTKPGGMLLAFGGTRTFHWMTCAIEAAGWEIRDCMMWLYGSGFPKSLDISKAIDKAKGAEREVVGKSSRHGGGIVGNGSSFEIAPDVPNITAPATDLAREWNGWGTALKPAWEPIIVAMKPLDGTFAENAEKWGVAGINVGGGRIAGRVQKTVGSGSQFVGDGNYEKGTGRVYGDKGRWPANLILDEEAAGMLDEQSGTLKSGTLKGTEYLEGKIRQNAYGAHKGHESLAREGDSGGASRFFYCAKASKSERNAGCEGLPKSRKGELGGSVEGRELDPVSERFLSDPMANIHPTVKPLKLMEYLCTLTKTPTGGIVLDPFAGSGTTLLAAKNTGREYVGIEQSPEYVEIIKARLGVA